MIRLLFSFFLLLGIPLQAAPKDRIVDFSNWKNPSGTLFPLDQGWSFLPQTFADPREYPSWKGQAKPVDMPLTWDDLKGFGKVTHGTYLLEIKNYPQNMRMPSISSLYVISAYRFYVVYQARNGEMRAAVVARQGKAGNTPGTTIPWRDLDIYTWPPDIKPLAFVVQVSNFEALPGGFRQKPLFGEAKVAEQRFSNDRQEAILIFGMLVMIGLFNFALFTQRKEDRSSFFLFLFCFFACLRYIGLEDLVFSYQNTPKTWIWRMNWGLLRGYMLGPMFAAYITFFYFAFEKAIKSFYIKALWIYIAIMAPIVYYLAANPNPLSYPVWIVASVIMLAYVFIVGMRLYEIARMNVTGSHLAALSLIALVLATLNDTAIFAQVYKGPYLGRYVLVVFTLMQSLIIGQRFSIAFRKLLNLERGLRREVKQQTHEIKSMLDNLNQGLFLFGRDYKIQPHYSRRMEDILGDRQLTGKDAFELLFAGTDVSHEARERLAQALPKVFGGSPEEGRHHLSSAIREFKKAIPSQPQRILDIEWSPIANSEGIIDKVLVTVHDITEIRSLEKDSEARRIDAEIAHQILAIPEYIFLDFVETAYSILASNQQLIDQNRPRLDVILNTLLTNYYDLHMAARTYRFQSLADLLKLSQERLIRYMENPESIDGDLLRDEVNELRNALQRYEWIHQEQLGRKTDRDIGLVKRKELKESLRVLNLLAGVQHAGARDAIDSVRRQMAGTAYCPPQMIIDEILIILQRLSKERGGEAPRLELDAENLYLTQDSLMKLRRIFLHMIRNSVEHGFESREERLRIGKSGVGNIHISLAVSGDLLKVTYHDDGRGMPIARMLQDGVNEGTFSTATTPEAVVSAMWNHTGGKNARDLGMQSIKQQIESCGGQIRIQINDKSEVKEFYTFSFEMLLPKNSYFQIS